MRLEGDTDKLQLGTQRIRRRREAAKAVRQELTPVSDVDSSEDDEVPRYVTCRLTRSTASFSS